MLIKYTWFHSPISKTFHSIKHQRCVATLFQDQIWLFWRFCWKWPYCLFALDTSTKYVEIIQMLIFFTTKRVLLISYTLGMLRFTISPFIIVSLKSALYNWVVSFVPEAKLAKIIVTITCIAPIKSHFYLILTCKWYTIEKLVTSSFHWYHYNVPMSKIVISTNIFPNLKNSSKKSIFVRFWFPCWQKFWLINHLWNLSTDFVTKWTCYS